MGMINTYPKYMLDTNICIYLMKSQPVRVVQKFSQCHVGEVVISAITWAELLRGLNRYQSQQQFDALSALITIVPFDANAAREFAQIMHNLNNQHTRLSTTQSKNPPKIKASFDTLIAAHAKALNVTLVSNNVADFMQYDVKVENWLE